MNKAAAAISAMNGRYFLNMLQVKALIPQIYLLATQIYSHQSVLIC
jgi:hypothetical protein